MLIVDPVVSLIRLRNRCFLLPEHAARIEASTYRAAKCRTSRVGTSFASPGRYSFGLLRMPWITRPRITSALVSSIRAASL